jgi:diguanylate cyclase (GGDEF)-like protein
MINEQQARILVVDDDPANVELLAEIFDDEYEVLFATDGDKALTIAAQASPDLILLDVMMPGIDGFEVCAQLKAGRSTAGIPVIFITGMGDMEAETRGLELGAVDYVTKPINPPVVRMRVRNQVELKRARDALTRLATTDGLTGIANRRHFDEVLAREHARLARLQALLSLVICDIDHFKAFNDCYGHIAGDDCLRRVAHAIESAMSRPADLPARYGGEEFVCLLPDTDAAGAGAVGERVRQAVAALQIPHSGSTGAGVVTVSVGVACVECRPGRSTLAVVAQADEQLYLAKTGGRNRVCVVEPPASPAAGQASP